MMQIRILAVGTKMPKWVQEGYEEYAKRFPSSFKIQLIEIPPEKRTKQSDLHLLTIKEGQKILSLVKPHHQMIALAVEGKSWSTEQLANKLEQWQLQSKPLDFIIGGPEGLSEACLARAETQWSLSPLTFPHPLVRIVLIEQLYRALMILQGHPYHRV